MSVKAALSVACTYIENQERNDIGNSDTHICEVIRHAQFSVDKALLNPQDLENVAD